MREITIRDAVNEALHEEMRRDPSVCVLGTDMARRGGSFGATRGLLEEFGAARVVDGPVSEAALVGCGLGMAMTGLRPVVEISQTDWITIAMDQIVNQIAKIRYMLGGKAKVPLVIRTAGGGGRGAAAQHSQSLEAWFVHIPGLHVVTPSTPYDTKGLLKAAIRDDNPVLWFDHRLAYNIKGPVPENDYVVPLGVAEVKRAGRDVTVVAASMMVNHALAAAEDLAKEGIEAEVVDPRTLAPFDLDAVLASVKRTRRLVVVQEGYPRAGVGADILAQVIERAFGDLAAPPLRVTNLPVHMPYNRNLESMVLPSRQRIVQACREVCGAPSSPASVDLPVGRSTAHAGGKGS